MESWNEIIPIHVFSLWNTCKFHELLIVVDLFVLKIMLTNISYIFLISMILIIGGWAFKALISLAQGKPVEINFKN